MNPTFKTNSDIIFENTVKVKSKLLDLKVNNNLDAELCKQIDDLLSEIQDACIFMPYYVQLENGIIYNINTTPVPGFSNNADNIQFFILGNHLFEFHNETPSEEPSIYNPDILITPEMDLGEIIAQGNNLDPFLGFDEALCKVSKYSYKIVKNILV